MNILSRSEIGKDKWNSFCDLHPGAFWWWTFQWLDYQVERGEKEDLSFGVIDGNKLVAICPLFLEGDAFTMEGHPGPRPLRCDYSVLIGDELERLQIDHAIHYTAFRASPFDPECPQFSPKNYQDISWHTQVLDLTLSPAELWQGIRKSYRSLIHRAEETHALTVDEQGDLIRQFWELHTQCAGRETRPYRTWEMQAEWCKQGNGLIIAASLGGIVTAATYWILYKGCAYYASSAALHKDVTKALIWRAVQELKARGVEQLELGWIDYPNDPPGLGTFKQGFGGHVAPVVAVERRFA